MQAPAAVEAVQAAAVGVAVVQAAAAGEGAARATQRKAAGALKWAPKTECFICARAPALI